MASEKYFIKCHKKIFNCLFLWAYSTSHFLSCLCPQRRLRWTWKARSSPMESWTVWARPAPATWTTTAACRAWPVTRATPPAVSNLPFPPRATPHPPIRHPLCQTCSPSICSSPAMPVSATHLRRRPHLQLMARCHFSPQQYPSWLLFCPFLMSVWGRQLILIYFKGRAHTIDMKCSFLNPRYCNDWLHF